MDKLLRPERFDGDPNSPRAAHEWTHWLTTFKNFLSTIEKLEESQKLPLLVNYTSHGIYEYIADCKTYDEAVQVLNTTFVKPKSEIFARHSLFTRKQHVGESVDQYVQALMLLSKDCDFRPVNAQENRDDYIRDSFINGLSSSQIRQRLLENTSLKLGGAINQAQSLESAQKYSEVYNTNPSFINSTHSVLGDLNLSENRGENEQAVNTIRKVFKCYFCGNKQHSRTVCPAREAICHLCSKRGHFSKVCQSKRTTVNTKSTSASAVSLSQLLAAAPGSLFKSLIKVDINGTSADALIDTGSTDTYISEAFTSEAKIPVFSGTGCISMASTSLQSHISGYCFVNMKVLGHHYPNLRISILKDLCADVIIGHDILRQHSKVNVEFGGPKEPLSICSLSFAAIEPPRLFVNLSPNCKPIATKSRRFSLEDTKFISNEIRKLLDEGIIEESISPWRAQVLVTKNKSHKKRMVIDYSQTINLFTYLDAYPLPNVEKIVESVAKYKVFSTIDLQSAYHQIPIHEDEKNFTAFEADGNLYQFKRIPFGVTNGVACFQRVIDGIIKSEGLKGVYAFLDDVTVCGSSKVEHDQNLERFLQVVKKYNLTINKNKTSFSQNSIKLLGYLIENGTVKPDPVRLEPLIKLPLPKDSASLKRAIGMFAHYSKWISNFSEKIHGLVNCRTFPMEQPLACEFEKLKLEIVKSAVTAIEDNVPFVVETDASDHSIAAHLSQSGRPVAFFSRTLSKSEQRHSSIEKEAYAIVEALKKWRHFLIGRHFQLITDQRSVSFMFNTKHSSKIKNEKILRWRLELACYSYDITYRPGKENKVADAFSRVCSASDGGKLFDLHKALCHPGVTRMLHWLRSRNMPYSLEDVRKMTAGCHICRQLKPQFFKNTGTLIKATAPFERLSMDFKGPLPSSTRNKYLLTIVDEYSRFPFAYPCPDMSSKTVIRCLSNLFSIFGMPSYVHTDRGSSFVSEELKLYFQSKGIATSRTTPYNPQGNGQIERYNGIIWQTILLALKTKNLKVEHWETTLEEAMHSIRSLLCTATNCTPHERMFNHSRKSANGRAIPTWLTKPSRIYMKKFRRQSKYDPLLEEVELVNANPDYATIRYADGREDTVSVRRLAPSVNAPIIDPFLNEDADLTEDKNELHEDVQEVAMEEENGTLNEEEVIMNDVQDKNGNSETRTNVQPPEPVRRGTRPRRRPTYLSDYIEK